MPDHWIDELARSKKTVERGAPIALSAFCSSSCFDSTCDTDPGSTFRNPSTKTYSSSSASAFTYSFNSDFSPGARLRASSDKKALHAPTNNPARRSTFNFSRATPFRFHPDSTHTANRSTGTRYNLSCSSRSTTSSAGTPGSSSNGSWGRL